MKPATYETALGEFEVRLDGKSIGAVKDESTDREAWGLYVGCKKLGWFPTLSGARTALARLAAAENPPRVPPWKSARLALPEVMAAAVCVQLALPLGGV